MGQRAFYWLVSRINALSDALDKTLLLSLWWNSLKESLSLSFLQHRKIQPSFSLSINLTLPLLLSLFTLTDFTPPFLHDTPINFFTLSFLYFLSALYSTKFRSWSISTPVLIRLPTDASLSRASRSVTSSFPRIHFSYGNVRNLGKLHMLENSCNLWKVFTFTIYIYMRRCKKKKKRKRKEKRGKNIWEQTLSCRIGIGARLICMRGCAESSHAKDNPTEILGDYIRWKIFQRWYYSC